MSKGKTAPKGSSDTLRSSFITGAIALIFLIIGYQAALFIHKAAVTRMAANRDRPDTVYVVDRALARELLAEQPALPEPPSAPVVLRRRSGRAPGVKKVLEKAAPRAVESFRFNPNTVSVEDLQRLGFSETQALAIDRYRQKGGRFRRREDFAKSYVVADSVYERLAPLMDIPLLDINRADSTALLDLPGIGPYFAGKIVRYRERLRGYTTPLQLLEIYHVDKERYEGLKDLVRCSAPEPYPIWTLPEEELARHPHISRAEAHAIVLFRTHNPSGNCTLEGLKKAGILSSEHAGALSLCSLSPAP